MISSSVLTVVLLTISALDIYVCVRVLYSLYACVRACVRDWSLEPQVGDKFCCLSS